MSLAEVVVVTVGNRTGLAERQDRSRPANIRVAADVPATAFPANAAEGLQRRGWLDPVPRSSKLTRVNRLLNDEGTRDARREV
jgi:hypothetical protein